MSVSLSLTVCLITLTGSFASSQQTRTNIGFAAVASRVGAELLNVCVDASGGMATGAFELVRAFGDEGERRLAA